MEERRKRVEEITDCPYRDDCGILAAYRKGRYRAGIVESYCMQNPEFCPRFAFRQSRQKHGEPCG